MRLNLTKQFVAILLLLSLSGVGRRPDAQSSSVGTIDGLVLDDKNEPVESAMITSQPEDAQLIGKMPVTKSGPGGRFSLSNVPAGKNFLFVGNPKEGYPDTQLAVFTPKGAPLYEVVVE